MNLKLSIFLAFIFAALTEADDTSDTSCPDDLQCSSCLCVSKDNSFTLAKGDTTTLCAHFVTVDNTTGCIVAYRAAYPVVVDTFSSIQLKGGQTNFQKYGYVEIVVQVYGNVTSVPLTYLQLTEFYSSAFSIIIELNNGVVQSAYWDHECATCSSSDCYKFTSNGTLIDNICNSPSCISTNDSSCDPQIYVAWIGTDSNGNQLTSAGMRLSRFDQFSLSDIVSANTISPYVVPNATNTTNATNSSTAGDPTTTTGTGTDTSSSSGSGDSSATDTGSSTDASGNKTDTGSSTDTSGGNSTDTGNSTDASGNKTDTGNSTDTTNPTDTSAGTSSGDSNSTGTSSGSTGSDDPSKTNTTTTETGTDTSSSSSSGDGSATDTGSSTTGTDDASTKDDPTTVTK